MFLQHIESYVSVINQTGWGKKRKNMDICNYFKHLFFGDGSRWSLLLQNGILALQKRFPIEQLKHIALVSISPPCIQPVTTNSDRRAEDVILFFYFFVFDLKLRRPVLTTTKEGGKPLNAFFFVFFLFCSRFRF